MLEVFITRNNHKKGGAVSVLDKTDTLKNPTKCL